MVEAIFGAILMGFFSFLLGGAIGVALFGEDQPVDAPGDIKIYITKGALALAIFVGLIGAVVGGVHGMFTTPH